MTKFKICGIKDLINAKTVRNANADFMGFVFVPGSRRKLDMSSAKTLIDSYRDSTGSGGPALVGLFADQPLDYVNEVIEQCGLDYVQLCGQEATEYWANVNSKVIKSISADISTDNVKNDSNLFKDSKKILDNDAIPLYDKFEKGQLGGTGKSFDWTSIEGFSDSIDFILAGGLNPENVGNAIQRITPWCVDVSTGVETDGRKDPDKILKFSEEVQSL
tara:strand:- start:333 stop:986 length:654 start_codon:yes stop_codon:yes gene_type:complete